MARDWSIPFAVGFGLAAIVIAVAKLSGWSNGALGIALMGVYMLGAYLRVTMHDYSADRHE